jgi:hypothetical protein
MFEPLTDFYQKKKKTFEPVLLLGSSAGFFYLNLKEMKWIIDAISDVLLDIGSFFFVVSLFIYSFIPSFISLGLKYGAKLMLSFSIDLLLCTCFLTLWPGGWRAFFIALWAGTDLSCKIS